MAALGRVGASQDVSGRRPAHGLLVGGGSDDGRRRLAVLHAGERQGREDRLAGRLVLDPGQTAEQGLGGSRRPAHGNHLAGRGQQDRVRRPVDVFAAIPGTPGTLRVWVHENGPQHRQGKAPRAEKLLARLLAHFKGIVTKPLDRLFQAFQVLVAQHPGTKVGQQSRSIGADAGCFQQLFVKRQLGVRSAHTGWRRIGSQCAKQGQPHQETAGDREAHWMPTSRVLGQSIPANNKWPSLQGQLTDFLALAIDFDHAAALEARNQRVAVAQARGEDRRRLAALPDD